MGRGRPKRPVRPQDTRDAAIQAGQSGRFGTSLQGAPTAGGATSGGTGAGWVNDFDGPYINIQTVAYMGWEYACADCGHVTGPDFPAMRARRLARRPWVASFILAARRTRMRTWQTILGICFALRPPRPPSGTRGRAAAGMLEQTMGYIMGELKRATFLGIDETCYSVNGKGGYAWVVRTDRDAFVLPMGTEGG